ncbi:glycine zipper domain-containing protein [Flavisolibacter tropicus]|uniref:glycine zipper domain-containing protein n=1 Tax=Flavisolibacter tropicus TaxID=1492898 RepID=UPI001D04368A|nr:glycine zipper domain-containing protein [Flavisolibacter tropicus]
MKFYSLLFSAAVLATACNSKPDAASTTATPTVDTGMVIVGPEIAADSQQLNNTPSAEAKETAPPSKSTHKSAGSNPTSSHQSSAGNAGNSASAPADGAASTGTENSTAKKGWSKTAKGAVIGGVTGAAAGAVINKKNRGVGAVVGGVTGAAAGAVIGNQMDKKDGRH